MDYMNVSSFPGVPSAFAREYRQPLRTYLRKRRREMPVWDGGGWRNLEAFVQLMIKNPTSNW